MKVVVTETRESPPTGKWEWIPMPMEMGGGGGYGGFKVSLNGYTATQHHPNENHKGLWELTAPEKPPGSRGYGSARFRCAPYTALRRFAHLVQTGTFNDLTERTQGVPDAVDKLWSALLARLEESERLIRSARVGFVELDEESEQLIRDSGIGRRHVPARYP